MDVREITIDELVERYSVLLFDAFGVLSYSVGALPGAAALIDRLNRVGKPYYVLTNDSSALPERRAARYRTEGLNVEAARIITSGGLLTGYFAANDLRGSNCAVLGTADSAEFVRRAGGIVVDATDEFDVLVVGDQDGFPFVDGVNAALTTLFRMIDGGDTPRLVLPNPDIVFPDDDGFGMASGSVALIIESGLEQRYPDRAELRFDRLGKPNGAIFAEARALSGTMDMVMLGDTLETDIRGANNFGIESALVAGGVTPVAKIAASEDVPTYWIRDLQSR
ncbi:MAG: HAD hydrolase-like protein [Chloroflexi bacterium]|nr:HAD hydrolase-like protein [Chloroflexota bacterium]